MEKCASLPPPSCMPNCCHRVPAWPLCLSFLSRWLGINFRPPRSPLFRRVDNNIAVSKGHRKKKRRAALEIDEVGEGFVM